VAGIRHKSGSRSYTYYTMKNLSGKLAEFEADGTVFGAINKKQFENLAQIVPPSAIVEKFESIAFPLDEQLECRSAEINSLMSIRDTLLPKLISGDLRVAEVEPKVWRAGL
ncbi:MAG: hypothetical protein ABIE92_01380, partial [bacterium]